MTTIRDIATKANTSIATVSRVINNQSGFSQETKERVEKVIEEREYEPNAIARGLIKNKTNTIGVMFPNIASMLTSELLNGIENVAQSRNFSIIVSYTYSSPERTMEYLKTLKEKRIDGLIFTSDFLTDKYISYMKKMNIPIVLLSTITTKAQLPFVKVDDFKASYAAVEYLINKGHTKIALLSGNPEDTIAGEPRIAGYKKALQDHHLPCKDNQIAYGYDFNFQDGKNNLGKLLSQFPEMTAIFAASDEMAVGAIASAHERNILIPDELSIIGYDNILISEMASPSLTTVGQPLFDMGCTAANLLFKKINNEELIETEVYLPYKIVERNSVQKLN